MKTSVITFQTAALVLAGALAGSAFAAENDALKDAKAKVSYSFGLNIGSNMKRQEIEVDYDALLKGIQDSHTGAKPLLTEEESRKVLNDFRTEHTAKLQAKRKAAGEKSKADGEKFLAENKTKPGVITTASGLQYKIITEGSGASPKPNDTVSVNYKGTLIDGTEFDSSYKRGQPAKFNVNFVIKGWTEALTMMKPGAKWQLFIPSALAYGEAGQGQNIGPNATLLFDVELLEVQAGPPQTPPEPVTSDIIKVPSAEELKKGAKIEVIKPDQLPKEQKK